MTRTGRLDAAEGEAVRETLQPLVAPLCREPFEVDAISLFYQDDHKAAFRLVRRYPLAAG
jgi:hypothetical protein